MTADDRLTLVELLAINELNVHHLKQLLDESARTDQLRRAVLQALAEQSALLWASHQQGGAK